MAVGENKNVEMCYLDDKAVAMSSLLAPDLVLAELKLI